MIRQLLPPQNFPWGRFASGSICGRKISDFGKFNRTPARLENACGERLDNTLTGSSTGADPGRGEGGSSHGQIFSTLEYFALTFLKILD